MFSGRKSSGEDLAKRGFQPFNAAPATRDAGDADQNDGFVSLNQCKRDRRTIEDFAAKKDFGKPPLETQPAPSHAPIAKKRRPQSANGSEPMEIPEELRGPMPKNEADFLDMLARAHSSHPAPCCRPKSITSQTGAPLEYRKMYRAVLVQHGGFDPVCASDAWDQIATKLGFLGHPIQELYKEHVLPFERIRALLLKQAAQPNPQSPALSPAVAAVPNGAPGPKLAPAANKPAVSDPRKRDPRKRPKTAAASKPTSSSSVAGAAAPPSTLGALPSPKLTAVTANHQLGGLSAAAAVVAPQSAAGQLMEQFIYGMLGVVSEAKSLPASFVTPFTQLVNSCHIQASSDTELQQTANYMMQLQKALMKHTKPANGHKHGSSHQNGHSAAKPRTIASVNPAPRRAAASVKIAKSGKLIVNGHPDAPVVEPGPAISESDSRLLRADPEIETVPAFNPTEAEFADPAAYLESIAALVDEKGMALINPPASWTAARVHEKADPNQYFYSKVQKIAHSQRDHLGDPGFTVDRENRYNLAEWKSFADAWKEAKFPDAAASPSDMMLMEQEFWTAMTKDEKLQTRYCSDVEGMLVERSPWSATEIAKLNGTALSVIEHDIEGVTSPYLYIGMCGSFFCWHTEDNDLYSINYLHEGSNKTWYAIPPQYQAQMDAQFQTEFPKHFAEFPDMCYRKCFMMHPTSLREAGIPVYRHIQQPGQIAITVPKGYHAGFSHGFTLAESSNFGLKDWIPMGALAAEKYRWGNWETLIEMDELLWDLVKRYDAQPAHTHLARLAGQELSRRVQREMNERAEATKSIKTVKATTGACDSFEDLQGSRCHECRHPCYFSMVMRTNTASSASEPPDLGDEAEVTVACLAHHTGLEGDGDLTLWLWHSDDELQQWLSNHSYDVEPLPSLLDYELAQRSSTVQRSSTATKHGRKQNRSKPTSKTPEQKEILEKWWNDHVDGKDYTRTYLTKAEKKALAHKAGIPERKIDYWLWGERKALKKKGGSAVQPDKWH